MALDVPVINPEQAIVTLAGVPLVRVPNCGDQSGWHFVGDLPHTAIELCGAACEGFQDLGAVDFFSCDPSDGPRGP